MKRNILQGEKFIIECSLRGKRITMYFLFVVRVILSDKLILFTKLFLTGSSTYLTSTAASFL
jgi:hypothetical protein